MIFEEGKIYEIAGTCYTYTGITTDDSPPDAPAIGEKFETCAECCATPCRCDPPIEVFVVTATIQFLCASGSFTCTHTFTVTCESDNPCSSVWEWNGSERDLGECDEPGRDVNVVLESVRIFGNADRWIVACAGAGGANRGWTASFSKPRMPFPPGDCPDGTYTDVVAGTACEGPCFCIMPETPDFICFVS